jgi:hypothetical protein
VRADYGIYYNPNSILNSNAELQNFRQPNATITNPTYPDPYGGRDPFTFVSTAPQNITVNANDMENLQSVAYTGGVSQALTSELALHVDGVYNHLTNAAMTRDVNARPGSYSVPRTRLSRPARVRCRNSRVCSNISRSASSITKRCSSASRSGSLATICTWSRTRSRPPMAP